MFRVFVVIIGLPLALGLPDVYGVPPISADTPSEEFQHDAGQAAEDHKLFFDNTQNHEQEDKVPSSPVGQVESALDSFPLQSGLPPDGQSLKNSYSHGAHVEQSAQENSDKALNYNLDRSNFDHLQSPQDITNEELILSYKPQVVSKYANNQDPGLEYARYAPYHHAKYIAGVTKDLSFHHTQISQNAKYEAPQYQRTQQTPGYNANVYQSSRAQVESAGEYNETPQYRKSQKIPEYNANVYETSRAQVESAGEYNETPKYQRTQQMKYETPQYQRAQQIPEYYANVYQSSRAQVESAGGYNDQVDSNLNQETSRANVPSYHNYQYSQDIQSFETEKALKNPSYQRYDIPDAPKNTKINNPAYQTFVSKYQNSKVEPESVSLVGERKEVGLDAQNTGYFKENDDKTVSGVDQTYGIPPVESSVYRVSQYDLPVHESPEVYNQVDQTKKYDSSGYQRYSTSNNNHRTLAEQEGNLGGHEEFKSRDHGIDSYQRPVVPARYIAVFQKHRAPGRADISTASYITQAVHHQQPTLDGNGHSLAIDSQKANVPLVLPISYNDDYPPSGSISSTFISKDAYLSQPAYTHQVYRDGAQQEASAVSDVSNPSPQSSYGLPNF